MTNNIFRTCPDTGLKFHGPAENLMKANAVAAAVAVETVEGRGDRACEQILLRAKRRRRQADLMTGSRSIGRDDVALAQEGGDLVSVRCDWEAQFGRC